MSGNEYDRTIKHGEMAIGQIKANKTPAYPVNYELWYTYSCGFNRALNDAINSLLKKFGRVTPSEVQRIYDEYLSPVRLGNRVEEVSSLISSEINDVTEMLDGALETTGKYGESLTGASDSLTSSTDPKTVAMVVKSLVDATREMERNNRELEDKLIDSRSQISELQENLEAIRFESLTDELTGIANRKHFDHTILHATEEAENSGLPLSLLLSDIDHFKKFNDTHGHQTGDQVLRLVGQTLRSNIKGRDLAARYGGEEFAIILPETCLSDAVKLAERIRLAIRGKELVKRSTGDMLGRVTMSFGAVAYRPGETVESLIHRADVCLYAAKGGGRDCVKHEDDDDITTLSNVA